MKYKRLNVLRSTLAAARFCAAASVLLFAGCNENQTGPKPPYLAIVTTLTAWKGVTPPKTVKYRVHEVTGLKSFDREITVSPKDTTILSVNPGSYVIEAIDLPTSCVIPRGGPEQGITLLETDNTGIIRWSVECRTAVTLSVLSDGFSPDKEFVYRVRNASGQETIGIVPANDTLNLSKFASGEVTIDIGGVAPNCTVTSEGGLRQRITVEKTGGAAIAFRVVCSDEAKRPQILSFTSGYTLGASVFQFKVYDADQNIDGYYFNLTDCQGNSVLPEKRQRIRRGLRGGRGQVGDTLTIVGAFELGIAPSELVGRCTEIRVFDATTNVSEIAVHKIGSDGGSPPAVRFMNSALVGLSFITTAIEASDPDNDIVGTFVLVRVRDGVLALPDGVPDLGSMDPIGYLGLDLPLIPTTGRIKWDDVYEVIVYVIDSKGNAIRVSDEDMLR